MWITFHRCYILQVLFISHVVLCKTFLLCSYYVPWYMLSFSTVWRNMTCRRWSFLFFSALCFCGSLPFNFDVTFSLVFIFLVNQHISRRNIVESIAKCYTHQVFVRICVILIRIWFNDLVVRVALDYQSNGSEFETTT